MGNIDDRVMELAAKCGLPAKDCKAALKEHGEVDTALGALIDSGKVEALALDPETVSLELFRRAVRRRWLDIFRRMQEPKKGLMGMFAAITQQAAGGRTPEQMLAEDEASEKKRGIDPMSAARQLRDEVREKRKSAKSPAKKKGKPEPRILKLPPFPLLTDKHGEWQGTDVLEAWAGTTKWKSGEWSELPAGSKGADGTLEISIPRHWNDDEDNPTPPAPEQVAAYGYLKENQKQVTENVLKALLEMYIAMRDVQWKKNKVKFPEITSVEQMRRNVGLNGLHMHATVKNGVAYIGIQLGCTWDGEHGTGVVLHRDRVVEVGEDVSFSDWAGSDDGGKPLEGWEREVID